MRRSVFLSVKNGLVVLGALLAFEMGCGGDGEKSHDAAGVAPSPGIDASINETGGPGLPYCTNKPARAGVNDLSGTWVARLGGSQMVNAPIVGALQVKTIVYVLARIAQHGTRVEIDGRYCDRIEIDPATSLAPAVIPDAWAHTESPFRRTGTYAVGNDGVPALNLPVSGGGVEVVGAVLASPSDPLPSSASDPRVIDQDGDHHPGITISIGGMVAGSLYAVQKQTTSMIAIPVDDDRVEGVLSYSSVQNVLASNPESIAALYAQSTAFPDPVACNSSFTMVRVAGAAADGGASDDAGETDAATAEGGITALDGGSSISCAWLRDHEAALFPNP